MFGFFKKQFTVNDFIGEIKNIHNSVEDRDECHKKVYYYCRDLQTKDLNIHYHKQLFQCLSFMESEKLRDELTDFDRQRNILIIQGICMDTADRNEVTPTQLSVTFHNYCEYLVKNGRTKEISNLLSSINSGIRQRFNSAINKNWHLDELIIRNRLLLEFYSIINANMIDQENTYGLGIDGIYNNLAKNNLELFYNNTIVYTFIPTEYYDEKSMATAVWDETLKNNMIINIILDKPIPRNNIIINPDNDEPVSSFIPVILSEIDITSDIPCFHAEIISEPVIDNSNS